MPGLVKEGPGGQLPSFAGSPPILTHFAWDGVGPSRTKSMNHPGGQTPEFGGEVIVQVFPVQITAGNIVRLPIVFP